CLGHRQQLDEPHYIAQAGLQLLGSSKPPPQPGVAGTIGMHHRARLLDIYLMSRRKHA
uniref:Uncharacterized protein n=1 Tax=Prolemur simus TaxID=1328070 RepID=A0A8C8ZLF8_PROSS